MIFFLVFVLPSSFFLDLPCSLIFLDLSSFLKIFEDPRRGVTIVGLEETITMSAEQVGRDRDRDRDRDMMIFDPKRRREGETVERQTRTDEGRAVLSLSYHCLITAASSSHSLTCLIPSCLISLPRCSH